ncbi:hypothetical protein [Glutamicibacter creatinolyticus]|uniref:hypothetical protein n=1 Tax=Glutamicibacter creatinolyticus TaxID=162496 RepID=UPI0032172BFA
MDPDHIRRRQSELVTLLATAQASSELAQASAELEHLNRLLEKDRQIEASSPGEPDH